MPRAKKRTPEVEKVRPYVEGVAKNLLDKLYGPDGPPWGTRLSQLEDLFLAIRELRSEALLDHALARQAAAPDRAPAAARLCPGCRRPLTCDDTQQRILETRAGEAEWAEPHAYCDRCRRPFFPRVANFTGDSSRRL